MALVHTDAQQRGIRGRVARPGTVEPLGREDANVELQVLDVHQLGTTPVMSMLSFLLCSKIDACLLQHFEPGQVVIVTPGCNSWE